MGSAKSLTCCLVRALFFLVKILSSGVSKMHFVIITGVSGSGKSVALKAFEDLGFFCIDNIPPALILKFSELCLSSAGEIPKVALGIDIRERDFLGDFPESFVIIRKQGNLAEILFLDARDDVLIRRFSETRRKHPLAERIGILEGIGLERKMISPLKEMADLIIDTSDFNIHDLQQTLTSWFLNLNSERKVRNFILSFGYKYGLPFQADLIFDVRFLPNPFFKEEYQSLNGLNETVMDFVLSAPKTKEFMEHLLGFIKFLLPEYEREGKSYLTIAIGCTGGKHRSVVIAAKLGELLKEIGYNAIVNHRDVNKE